MPLRIDSVGMDTVNLNGSPLKIVRLNGVTVFRWEYALYTDISLWEAIKAVVQRNGGVGYTKTTSTFGSLSGGDKYFGGVLAPNGKIYGVPRSAATVLEIDLGLNLENFPMSSLLSAYINNL